MEPIQNKFISSWQLCMLITGQSDKMLRDLRESKGSRQLSATSMEILVSGVSPNVLNVVVSLVCLAKV